ncbi:glutathione synthetase [Streptomyces sp. NPDC004647]|uniref:glutathione synthetase n=1 Tax=Streptomyces sp. NPDC004647 TaxID=3154671 RepID=UPI0033AC9319
MALASSALAVAAPPAWRTGVAAVIGPAGAGHHYCTELARQGWDCVAVILPTARPAAELCGTAAPPYLHRVRHDGSLRRTTKALRALGVGAVIAGSADGTELADRIAHRLELPGNDPTRSELRQDLGRTAAALTRAGITAPRVIRTTHLEEALAWAAHCRLPQSVLKPADPTSPDSGHLCRTSGDIRSAWQFLQHPAHAPRPLVLQEHLHGTQYLVHTVSSPGLDGTPNHTVTEIWSDTRTTDHRPYRTDLMSRHGLLPRALALYTLRILTALGITHGPARSQIIYEPDRGPVLLSLRTDPHDTFTADVLYQATGSNPIRDTVHTLTTGRAEGLARTGRRPHLTKVSLVANRHGALCEPLLHTLVNLPTVVATTPLDPGASVLAGTSPGQLLLMADDIRAINQDHQTIRAAESLGLYGWTTA